MPPRDAPSSTTTQLSNREENGVGNGQTNGKILKNRPKASALRQQKLPAWQPILTASTVIPTVIAIGIIFIPIGIALFLSSDSVHEFRMDYTDCGTTCQLTFNLPDDYSGDVYIYYYLDNYYQNHRRYVKSRNDQQYLGDVMNVKDCAPFDKDAAGTPIAPCGAIANSIFNDTFKLYHVNGLIQTEVPVTTNGVVWDVDKERKFKNPKYSSGETLCDAFKGTVRPPNWNVDPCSNGGFENVDFIVWMRTAALPNFRKLWRLVDRSPENQSASQSFENGLPAGQYVMHINNIYPVKAFGGKKEFIVSTTSWAGGKNSFLGIAYLVVGSLAILLGIVFIIIHIRYGHSMSELSNVSRLQH